MQTTKRKLSTNESSIEYDPLEGFRLKWKGFGAVKNPWGDYVCIGKVNNGKVSKEEKLRIRVKGPNSTVNRCESIFLTCQESWRHFMYTNISVVVSLGGVGNGQSTSTSGGFFCSMEK